MRRFRATGSVAAKPMGGDHRSRLTAERTWILERIEAEPDLTLEEPRGELRDRGIVVGHGTVCRFFAREDVTFKKSVHAAEQERPDVADARREWKDAQTKLGPAKLIFVDETGASTQMARLSSSQARSWGGQPSALGSLEDKAVCGESFFLDGRRFSRYQIRSGWDQGPGTPRSCHHYAFLPPSWARSIK